MAARRGSDEQSVRRGTECGVDDVELGARGTAADQAEISEALVVVMPSNAHDTRGSFDSGVRVYEEPMLLHRRSPLTMTNGGTKASATSQCRRTACPRRGWATRFPGQGRPARS